MTGKRAAWIWAIMSSSSLNFLWGQNPRGRFFVWYDWGYCKQCAKSNMMSSIHRLLIRNVKLVTGVQNDIRRYIFQCAHFGARYLDKYVILCLCMWLCRSFIQYRPLLIIYLLRVSTYCVYMYASDCLHLWTIDCLPQCRA